MPVDQYIGGIETRFYTCFIHGFHQRVNKFYKDFNITEPFKNLFTQGMVCHETYKDSKGNWLYPEEVEKSAHKKQ